MRRSLTFMLLGALSTLSLGCIVHRTVNTGDDRNDQAEDASGDSAQGSSNAPPPSLAEPEPEPEPAPAPTRAGPPVQEELGAIRAAIVEALRESSEDWAPGVLASTERAPYRIEGDGTARIGHWTLRPCEQGCETLTVMRFVYRTGGNQTPSYAAEIRREGDGFRCSNLGIYLIVPSSSGAN